MLKTKRTVIKWNALSEAEKAFVKEHCIARVLDSDDEKERLLRIPQDAVEVVRGIFVSGQKKPVNNMSYFIIIDNNKNNIFPDKATVLMSLEALGNVLLLSDSKEKKQFSTCLEQARYIYQKSDGDSSLNQIFNMSVKNAVEVLTLAFTKRIL